MWKFIFTYQSHGLGQAKPEPSHEWQLWPGLRFEEAKAASGQAKARAFRPSWAGTALTVCACIVEWLANSGVVHWYRPLTIYVSSRENIMISVYLWKAFESFTLMPWNNWISKIEWCDNDPRPPLHSANLCGIVFECINYLVITDEYWSYEEQW